MDSSSTLGTGGSGLLPTTCTRLMVFWSIQHLYTQTYMYHIYYTLFRCTEGSTKLWLILSYSELTNMGAFVGWFAWPLRVQVKWKYIDLEWYWSLADYSTIIDPFVLVILYIPYNCCCIYVHPSFPVVQIHSRVDMVETNHNDLLSQWRHIPLDQFHANNFSNYLWASGIFKNQCFKSQLFSSSHSII